MAEDVPVRTAPRVSKKQANAGLYPTSDDDNADPDSPAAAADHKAAHNRFGYLPEHWPAL